MWKSAIKVAAATTAFAVVHSLFASRAAKDAAARLLGKRRRNALYRPFYLVQSALTLALLDRFIRTLPDRDLYRLRGPLVYVLHSGQVVAMVYAVAAAQQVGIPEMLGITGLLDWARGSAVQPEPEAQGPRPGSSRAMKATGPFAWSRHPLNLVPFLVFWLSPRMTVKLLSFNLVSTVYLVAGSIHEETRLRAAYGSPYERYQQSGIPFYLPGVKGGKGDGTG